LVAVHATVEGLNGAICASVKTIAVLVPSEVFTTRLPLADPVGTVVTIKPSDQSAPLAIAAETVPVRPAENSTWLEPWVLPKFEPSMITVLPAVALGSVAPLTANTIGGPDGPVPVDLSAPLQLVRTVNAKVMTDKLLA
jgi:hypothetical protein